MTNEELVKEFKRWIDADRPMVWFKEIACEDEWETTLVPKWNNYSVYIVDDKHAEIRKMKNDDDSLVIEFYDDGAKKWREPRDLNWDLRTQYRIKPETKTIYEWMYKLNSTDRWFIDEALMTEKEAEAFFDSVKAYRKTGREFEVEV